MLPLHGTATAVRGFDAVEPRQVFRLRSPLAGSRKHSADLALVRQPEDFAAAISADFVGTLVVSDATEMLPHGNALPRTVQVPSRFEYLADGDILGFHPASKKSAPCTSARRRTIRF